MASSLTEKLKKYGVVGFVKKAAKHVWRQKLHCRYVAYCGWTGQDTAPLPVGYALRCCTTRSEMEPGELEQLHQLKGETHAEREFRERFSRGARFWMLKEGPDILCFVWSYKGLSLDGLMVVTERDAYLSDGGCFPRSRGKGAFAQFFDAMLTASAELGIERIYFATLSWNKFMIKSAAKTVYWKIGVVDHLSLFGLDFQVWHGLRNPPAAKQE